MTVVSVETLEELKPKIKKPGKIFHGLSYDVNIDLLKSRVYIF